MTALTAVCCGCGKVRVGSQWIEVEAGRALERNTICAPCRARLYPNLVQGGATAARRPHKPEVASSILAPATNPRGRVMDIDINPWSWTTKDEIAFVRRLGHHLEDLHYGNHRRQIFDRLELLRSYRQTMQTRSRWGRVDPQLVAAVVDQEIAAEIRLRQSEGAA